MTIVSFFVMSWGSGNIFIESKCFSYSNGIFLFLGFGKVDIFSNQKTCHLLVNLKIIAIYCIMNRFYCILTL